MRVGDSELKAPRKYRCLGLVTESSEKHLEERGTQKWLRLWVFHRFNAVLRGVRIGIKRNIAKACL